LSVKRTYETMFIVAPTVGPDAHERLVASFESIITENDGTMLNTIKWGVRTLAYEIAKFREGIYTIFEYEAPGTLIQELERRMRLNDSVLKFLTIKTERKKKLLNKGAAKRNKREARKKRKAGKQS